MSLILPFSAQNQIKREKLLAKRALQDMVESRPAKEKEVAVEQFNKKPWSRIVSYVDTYLYQGVKEA